MSDIKAFIQRIRCRNYLQLLLLFAVSPFIHAAVLTNQLATLNDLNHKNCPSHLMELSNQLDSLQIEDYQRALEISNHELLLNELFRIKINIHSQLQRFYSSDELSKACADAARHAFRSIRTTEDYFHLNLYHLYKDSLEFPDNAFTAGNPHINRHPYYSNFNMISDLRSGDILLTRGNAFTSAAIANLGEFDTQFSHMSMVYRKNNGELWTIEAHIEVGSFVRPLQDHISDKNYRTMIFRFHDSALAAQAAEYIYHKVKKASETSGNILYDFAFDQEESEKLFCSEVISHAFEYVSKEKTKMPLFPSKLQARKPTFVKLLGIEALESFVPADIEVDPRFSIIAEWRDAARTQENLQKDAILQAMFQWNDQLGYQMIQSSSSTSLIYRNVAWPLRRVPYLKKYFVDKLPLNMSRELIGYFGVLESTGKLLQAQLKVKDQHAVEEHGFPLLKEEKAEVLNKYRMEDLARKKKKLHRMYRPPLNEKVESI
jgi:hypothetical protein